MIIDLTHTLAPGIPTWPGDPRLVLDATATIDRDSWYLQTLTLGEQTGTHIGVAAHMTEGGTTVENLPPELLIRPAAVIDLRRVMTGNDLLGVDAIRQWEDTHGAIEKGSVLLLNTGWDRFWKRGDYETYLDMIPDGCEPGGRIAAGYPGYSLEAARFLAEKRGVVGLGIDTAGIDGGLDMAFSVNRYWLHGERYHLENLTGLEKLPPRGATIFIGALPIENGSGSPVRVLAMVP